MGNWKIRQYTLYVLFKQYPEARNGMRVAAHYSLVDDIPFFHGEIVTIDIT